MSKDLSKSGIDPTQGAIGDENPFATKIKLKDEFSKSLKKVKSTPVLKGITTAIEFSPTLLPFPNPDIKMLALDVATTTGWCTNSASGIWNLTPKKDESGGMRLIRFRAKLREICESEQIKLIVFEQLATYGKFPNFVAGEMQGILKIFCEENKIDYKSFAPTAIKKFATGSGVAKKEEMVAAAKKYKPSVESNDEADAIILYRLAIDDLKLNP